MKKRVIISGGGTGGHIFPAIAIGTELRQRIPDIDILYVGAEGGREMTWVPEYGFPIERLWISGIARSLSLRNIGKNLAFPFKLLSSLMKARKILRKFQPQVVVGVGGYASGPMGRAAASKGVPLVLCEQNAYPGITNKWLADEASKILLGNEAAAKYFPADKCIYTGNPIRQSLKNGDRKAGFKAFGLDPEKPVILSLGGSLGARTINRALLQGQQKFLDADVQLIWQCGKAYHDELRPQVKQDPRIKLMPFIGNMADVYACADVVISRAGGSTISEIIMLEKPAILVPSPNVAEDHQTKNALSLSQKDAAILVPDSEADKLLVDDAIDLVKDEHKRKKLLQNLQQMEKTDAAARIADEIISLLE